MNPRKIIGTAIALAGTAIVIGLPEKRPALIPVLLVAFSGLFWALGQVLARRLSHDEGIVMLKANALMGVPQLAVATLLFESGQWQSVVTATPLHWANFAFVAVVGFYLGYIAWFSLLRRVRMDEAIPFTLLMTPFGIATAAFVLGESVSMAQILGGAVLLFGLAIVNNVIFSRRSVGSSA
jgi:O-acetylserine/cysteine efflux transporter